MKGMVRGFAIAGPVCKVVRPGPQAPLDAAAQERVENGLADLVTKLLSGLSEVDKTAVQGKIGLNRGQPRA